MIVQKERFTTKSADYEIISQWGKNVNDPYRPVYHPIAPHGWMNDPNGLIYYDGWYHVFYQWNPYDSKWGNIHWGHMRTKDFNNWIHMSCVLSPDQEYDRDGCFSGSAVIDNNNKLHLVYTCNRFEKGKHQYNGGVLTSQAQCLASVDNDGLMIKSELNPIIKTPPTNGDKTDFRDPKVFREHDYWCMLVGSRNNNNGEILKYTSKNLVDWNYEGMIAKSEGKLSYMWECPDLLKIENQEVLMFSPMNVEQYNGLSVSGYIKKENNDYNANKFLLIDYGPNFYAPQSFNNSTKTIILGWISMPTMNYLNHNWCGALSLPRELNDSNDGIKSKPYTGMCLEKKLIYKEHNKELKCNESIMLNGDTVELTINTVVKSTGRLFIKLKAANDLSCYSELIVDYNNKKIKLDLSNSDCQFDEKPSNGFEFDFPKSINNNNLDIQIFVDKTIVEIFAFDGLYVNTFSVFSKPVNKTIFILADNSTIFNSVHLFEIEPTIHSCSLNK